MAGEPRHHFSEKWTLFSDGSFMTKISYTAWSQKAEN
jgi:hypothetical protein